MQYVTRALFCDAIALRVPSRSSRGSDCRRVAFTQSMIAEIVVPSNCLAFSPFSPWILAYRRNSEHQ